MAWSNMKLGEDENNSSQDRENRLVLSINQNGEIVFFNKNCEKIAGYSKNEALDKRILDLLIPERDRDQWEKIFDSTIHDQSINSFELPWVTRKGQEIMASWTIAPVSNKNTKMGDIGIVGEIESINDDIQESIIKDEESDKELEDTDDYQSQKKDIVLFRFKNKRIIFRRRPSTFISKEIPETEIYYDFSKIDESQYEPLENVYTMKKEPAKKDKETTKEKKDVKEEEEIVEDPKHIFRKYDHDTLVKNYEAYNNAAQSIKELEDKNNELEQENKKLKNDLNNATKRLEYLEKNKEELTNKNFDLLRDSINFIFDAVGGKKKKEEFDEMINKLEERRTVLQDLETKLNEDKKDLNKSRDEFVKWREKLEKLEDEIEKRNKKIEIKEEKVRKNLSFFVDEDSQDEPLTETSEDDEVEHHKILDKIPHSAAIIQRGILKQVNENFIDLLGYNVDKILEKNLFDFVISEGFSGIEKYYLKRLKGENIASYETMFHTKQDDNIAVEVSTKPIIFNGEKAEIAVFKKLTNKLEEDVTINKIEENKLTNLSFDETENVSKEIEESDLKKNDVKDLEKKSESQPETEESSSGEVKKESGTSEETGAPVESEEKVDDTDISTKSKSNIDSDKEIDKKTEMKDDEKKDKNDDLSDEEKNSKYEIVKKLKNNEL